MRPLTTSAAATARRWRRAVWRGLALLACVPVLVLGGCGGGPAAPGPGASADTPSGEVTVFAAASLTEAFTEIAADFEAAHPGVTVRLSFAGSSTLAQQITRGAPAGVFASADRAQMRVVADAGRTASEPTVFVQNTLRIVVPQGNPGEVHGLADFARPDLRIAVCAAEVPCGAAAREAFAAAGVDPQPDTLERDVKAVLTKVRLGEVDAGLVYATDVASAGQQVEGIAFPAASEAVNDYAIAVLTHAPHPQTAHAFTDYVLSAHGMSVLKQYGFVTDVS